MADKQTVQAVYRLNFVLRVPGEPTGKKAGEGPLWKRPPIWLPAGYEATTGELAGLQLPALQEGGFIKRIKEAEVPCDFCQAHGTAAQKKERYSSLEAMRDHYQADHPGVRPTESF